LGGFGGLSPQRGCPYDRQGVRQPRIINIKLLIGKKAVNFSIVLNYLNLSQIALNYLKLHYINLN